MPVVVFKTIGQSRFVSRTREKSSEESGANSVEFALILPLLLILIFGLVDFARMGFVQLSVTNASREGARLSSLYTSGEQDPTQFVTFVRETAPGAASVSQLDSNVALNVQFQPCSPTLNGENTSVTVSTLFNWTLPVGLWQLVTAKGAPVGNFQISSTGVMRCIS
jgi:Flp pilus assembly protein TadG